MSLLLRPVAWNDENARPQVATPWLWPGLLAQGSLTLLTGGWKSGKTTLVAMLLDRRRAGGLLLNRDVRPGSTVVVSEEDQALWQQRQRRLSFGPRVGFLCRPFAGPPTPERWRALLDHVLELHHSHEVDLVIIDPLAMFLPGSENHSRSLLGPLTELQRLTQRGMSVLLLHHPPKKEPRLGQAARGTGALAACADILLELRLPSGDPGTRRRRLFGFARHEETPRRLALELNEGGTDYAVFADSEDDDAFRLVLTVVLAILRQAPGPYTRREIVAAWPAEIPAPERTRLWRWLTRATALGVLSRTGTGTKGDAFRYEVARCGRE